MRTKLWLTCCCCYSDATNLPLSPHAASSPTSIPSVLCSPEETRLAAWKHLIWRHFNELRRVIPSWRLLLIIGQIWCTQVYLWWFLIDVRASYLQLGNGLSREELQDKMYVPRPQRNGACNPTPAAGGDKETCCHGCPSTASREITSVQLMLNGEWWKNVIMMGCNRICSLLHACRGVQQFPCSAEWCSEEIRYYCTPAKHRLIDRSPLPSN